MEISDLKSQMDERFAAANARFEELKDLIAAEEKATRTHITIVVDQLRTEIKLAFDKMATGQ